MSKNINSQIKKQGLFNSNAPSTLYIFTVLLLLLAILQLSFNSYVLTRLDTGKTQHDQLIAELLVRSVEDLKRPINTDAETGKAYIASHKLSFPVVPDNLGEIYYGTFPTNSNDGTGLMFTTKAVMREGQARIYAANNPYVDEKTYLANVFEAMPGYQACAGRGITVSFVAMNEDNIGQSRSKQLADGRTMHIYTDKKCKADMSMLVQYILQAESY